MTEYGPFENVYGELEWYDGPRSGIADVNGIPHRFKPLFDEADDESLTTLAIESHPGHGDHSYLLTATAVLEDQS